jgi:hypothetical protein
MALTRKMLKAMGIEDEKIDQIIEAHIEVTDTLKAERDGYKADSDALKDVRKELETLKGGEDWKAKYEKEHSDFETFKNEQTEKAAKQAKETAYKQLLKDAGVSEKRLDSVLRVSDISKIELDKDGKVKNADELTTNIKTEWSDFIAVTEMTGATTEKPPANTGGTYTSKADIMKIADREARRQAIKDNPQLFVKGNE